MFAWTADRRDDHEELSYGGAAVAAVRVGASDCLAIHNVVSTSRGRASDLHPSNSHDYHGRLSCNFTDGTNVISAACCAMGATKNQEVKVRVR